MDERRQAAESSADFLTGKAVDFLFFSLSFFFFFFKAVEFQQMRGIPRGFFLIDRWRGGGWGVKGAPGEKDSL